MTIPTDIVFTGEPVTTHSQIIIHTTGNPREDLQTLLERVQAGDMPGSRELCAILEEVLSLMDHRNQSVFGNFSFYSYKKACGQKKTVRGSKNSRRLSNGTPAI